MFYVALMTWFGICCFFSSVLALIKTSRHPWFCNLVFLLLGWDVLCHPNNLIWHWSFLSPLGCCDLALVVSSHSVSALVKLLRHLWFCDLIFLLLGQDVLHWPNNLIWHQSFILILCQPSSSHWGIHSSAIWFSCTLGETFYVALVTQFGIGHFFSSFSVSPHQV